MTPTPRTVVSVFILAMAWSFVAEVATAADQVDYLRDVKPLLTKHCLACHSPVRQKSGYRIDTAAGVIGGGDRGISVVPGKSAESTLIDALTGTNDHPRMPPEEEGPALEPADIDLVRRWIDQGAKAPEEKPQPDPRKHWAFQPVKRPAVPKVKKADWVRNPIDAFVVAQQQKRGLSPSPEAPPHVLVRRLYLDLTGLPPTPQDLDRFLQELPAADREGSKRSAAFEQAYAALVDRLLASPAYGERWGRHWMDVWRYSDWAGWAQQIRDSQPHIWRWRDWIIEQLNADRPYDEMVTSMLAADELTPTDRDELRATGYLARNYKLLSREQWMQDTVEHTGKALLGLTLNCARCHDHMTDPIEQQEYYAFRAIFEPHQVRMDRVPGEGDVKRDGLPRVYDKDLAATTYLYIRGDERNPRKDKPIDAGVLSVLNVDFKVEKVKLPRDAYDPLRLAYVVKDDLSTAERAVKEAKQKRDDLLKQPADKAKPYDRELSERDAVLAEARLAALQAVVAAERLESAGDTMSMDWREAAEATVQAQRRLAVLEAQRTDFVTANDLATQEAELAKLQAGTAKAKPDAEKVKAQTTKRDGAVKKKLEAEKKVYQVRDAAAMPVDTAYTKRKVETYPEISTGRRTALARWVTDPRNPLPARVAANHLWGRHFERAIVPTTTNFGLQGAPPTHPELLDWLASELVEHDWKMKHLHRLIVMSSTYRQESYSDAQAARKLDPDNHYLWHYSSRRLEAEVVRDCVLAVAGQLDPAMGGADIDHQQGLTVKRRSLYFRSAAEKQMTFLKVFDVAGVNECYERRESVMPQQALALANSELTLVQSRLLARRLHVEHADDAIALITTAYKAILSRSPSEAERNECLKFLADQLTYFESSKDKLKDVAAQPSDGSRPSGDPALRARENLVHALFNHHEFVTLP